MCKSDATHPAFIIWCTTWCEKTAPLLVFKELKSYLYFMLFYWLKKTKTTKDADTSLSLQAAWVVEQKRHLASDSQQVHYAPDDAPVGEKEEGDSTDQDSKNQRQNGLTEDVNCDTTATQQEKEEERKESN